MKKRIVSAWLVMLLLLSFAVFTACDEEEEPHTHSFVDYVSDNNATCT